MSSAGPLSTSTSLLNQAQFGEQRAWYRLVETYTPLIVTWCRRYGIQGADAEDITQSVFLTASNHINDFNTNSPNRSFRGWLWTICRSRIVDHLRFRKRNPRAQGGQSFYDLELPGAELDTDISYIESSSDLKVLIASTLEVIRRDFSEQTWVAFWQTTVLNRRPSEVAREMDMSPAAVCMCRARVLKRLRETLGDF